MGRAGSAIIAVALVVLAGTAVGLDSPPGTVPAIAAAEVRSTFHFRYFIEGAPNQSETTVLLETSDGGVSYGFATSSVLVRPRASKGVGALPPLVRLHFEGSNPVEPSGNVELQHRSNVFLGRDPAGWKTSLRLYREVRYANLYDGVDLVYRLGAEGGLKYEFRLDRGVDPARILVRYEGVEDVGIGDAGELLVEAMFGTLRDDAPVAFQADLPVRCGFRTKAPRLVGFDCPDRNPSLPLVIDPLLYATFLGGAGRDEARAIAVDASGSAYITGMTGSMDFPSTPGAWSTTGHGTFDMFVAKLNANGTELEYATFIGGENEDEGYAIAVDAAGRAYVTGYTLSPDFPVTAGALDTSFHGGDAFLVRLGPRGDSLEYATLLGGANFDEGLSVALDPEGGAYIAGETLSVDFPTTEGAIQPIANGGWDGFLVHLDVAGHALHYGTYLGGVFSDAAHAVAVDSLGDAFVAGYTLSSNFPVTPGAFQTLLAGDFDVFVAEVSPDGRTLVYSTYVGSKGLDQAADLVPGPGGAVDVAGATSSPTFPVTSDGFDRTPNGGTDAFYFRLAPMGDHLLYSTYFGGSGADEARGLASDSAGGVVLAGVTDSLDLPDAPRGAASSHDQDGFLAWISGGSLAFAATFGGPAVDDFYGVALDAQGIVYIAGATSSAEFPSTPRAIDRTFNGDRDVVVLRATLDRGPPSPVAVVGIAIVVAAGVVTTLVLFWRFRRRPPPSPHAPPPS